MPGAHAKGRIIFYWSSAALLALACLYVFRAIWLAAIGGFLIVNDPLEKADAIIVLNGDPNTRPFEAVRLYQQGWAPKVVIARAENSVPDSVNLTMNTTELCIKVLHVGGVTDDHLVELRMPGGVRSTFDEATLLRNYAGPAGMHNVIVVTSEFHSRRARWIIRKVIKSPDIRIIMRPVANPKYGERNWWRMEDGVIGCQNEYIKLLFYWVHYRNISQSEPSSSPAGPISERMRTRAAVLAQLGWQYRRLDRYLSDRYLDN